MAIFKKSNSWVILTFSAILSLSCAQVYSNFGNFGINQPQQQNQFGFPSFYNPNNFYFPGQQQQQNQQNINFPGNSNQRPPQQQPQQHQQQRPQNPPINPGNNLRERISERS